MDKKKNIVIVILALIIVINIFNIVSLNGKINSLENQIYDLNSNTNNRISSLENRFNQNISSIDEILRKEHCLFSKASADITLQDNKLFVTMEAIPKEIKSSEKVIAKVKANNHFYEKELDENNSAKIEIDFCDSLTPSFVIKSSDSLKEEFLNDIYTTDFINVSVETKWDDNSSKNNKNVLNLWISENTDGLTYTNDDIKSAEFLLCENPTVLQEYNVSEGSTSAEAPATPINTTNSDFLSEEYEKIIRVPAKEIKSGFYAGFNADLTEYCYKNNEKAYDIYFTFETKDGIKFLTTINPVASFFSIDDNISKSSGSETIYPVFE